MTRLDHATEIIDLAAELGVGSGAPVDGILDYCRRRIDGWVVEAGGVTGIDALESLLTQRLQMTFEEIRGDDDWERLKDVYARGKKEFVFAGMRTKFDDDDNLTFGALVQRRNAGPSDPDRFVGVIDCRGNKLARRFFTRWHEIAHRLTTHADMLEPVYRSEHDPIERMMDEIAGHVGFYEPLFQPAYQQASEGKPLLKFGTVETIISGAFPAASFQATLFACARRLTTPVVYLEAGSLRPIIDVAAHAAAVAEEPCASRAVALGAGRYQADDKRLSESAPRDVASGKALAELAGREKAPPKHELFPRLIHSRRQAEAIADCLKVKPGCVFVDQSASEATVKKASVSGELAKTRYVHFASHVWTARGDAAHPYIVFDFTLTRERQGPALPALGHEALARRVSTLSNAVSVSGSRWRTACGCQSRPCLSTDRGQRTACTVARHLRPPNIRIGAGQFRQATF